MKVSESECDLHGVKLGLFLGESFGIREVLEEFSAA
jgi:hypothetical protein